MLINLTDWLRYFCYQQRFQKHSNVIKYVPYFQEYIAFPNVLYFSLQSSKSMVMTNTILFTVRFIRFLQCGLSAFGHGCVPSAPHAEIRNCPTLLYRTGVPTQSTHSESRCSNALLITTAYSCALLIISNSIKSTSMRYFYPIIYIPSSVLITHQYKPRELVGIQYTSNNTILQ